MDISVNTESINHDKKIISISPDLYHYQKTKLKAPGDITKKELALLSRKIPRTYPEIKQIPKVSHFHKSILSNNKSKDNINYPAYLDPKWDFIINSNNSNDTPERIGSNNIWDLSKGKSPGTFWIHDPNVLFSTFEVIPTDRMNNAERLNAMTRIIVIISAIMFLIKFALWWLFLLLGIMIVIIFWYLIQGKYILYKNSTQYQREYLRQPQKPILKPINTVIRPISSSESTRINTMICSATNTSSRLNLISIA